MKGNSITINSISHSHRYFPRTITSDITLLNSIVFVALSFLFAESITFQRHRSCVWTNALAEPETLLETSLIEASPLTLMIIRWRNSSESIVCTTEILISPLVRCMQCLVFKRIIHCTTVSITKYMWLWISLP